MKLNYEKPEIELIRFEALDCVMVSEPPVEGGDSGLPIQPFGSGNTEAPY